MQGEDSFLSLSNPHRGNETNGILNAEERDMDGPPELGKLSM
jgi:hypothetical protein